jgi:peptidyl-prolyl cis-trans isomerase A (cyclophilin A)
MSMTTMLRITAGVGILALGLTGGAHAEAEAEPGPEKGLLNPESLSETAPESYKVKFETTKGDFTLEVTRAWAPNGADRFYNLVKNGFYDETRFFRVLPGFVVQWGISGTPEVAEAWREANIPDDPVKESNKAGYVSYAKRGPGTRTTQVFINLNDNSNSLDGRGFTPLGPPSGSGPYQGRIVEEGNAYLSEFFAELDHIKKATVIP